MLGVPLCPLLHAECPSQAGASRNTSYFPSLLEETTTAPFSVHLGWGGSNGRSGWPGSQETRLSRTLLTGLRPLASVSSSVKRGHGWDVAGGIHSSSVLGGLAYELAPPEIQRRVSRTTGAQGCCRVDGSRLPGLPTWPTRPCCPLGGARSAQPVLHRPTSIPGPGGRVLLTPPL